MYYHCRDLKFVEYGKVYPPPPETIDPDFMACYDWLGKHCGYTPQIWLSRSTSGITGFRPISYRAFTLKKGRKKSFKLDKKNDVQFGFDIIKGFPVHYGMWHYVMSAAMYSETSKISVEDILTRDFRIIAWEARRENSWWGQVAREWRKTKDVEHMLKKFLFVEEDQVVVPSLNLKTAKKIKCCNEKQKKQLRKMGFIEDRIHIMNVQPR